MPDAPKATDNLTRMRPTPEAACMRAVSDDDTRNVLHGHFSVFEEWYEINSVYEGRFMERLVPGSFEDTLRSRRDSMKAQFDHGHDAWVGNSVLGTFLDLREDDVGGYYALDLLDTDYNRDRIIPQARAGVLGSSFRFSVPAGGDQWVDHPRSSDHNPERLPERTITRTEVRELGPVVFPANETATAGMRSTTDVFLERLLTDPMFVARLTDRTGVHVVEKMLSALPADGRSALMPEAADGPVGTPSTMRDPRAVQAIAAAKRAARKNGGAR